MACGTLPTWTTATGPAGGSVPAGNAPVSPPGEAHPCAAATTRCDGRIEVPLDRTDPRSERITVAFTWLPRKDLSRPAAGTVLADPGGPGPALPAVPALAEALGPVLDRQNLLVVEPRGLGLSSPLTCPDLDLERPESVRACAGHLGPRAAFHTAGQTVADQDAVRAALGVPKVTYYGISYGTLSAQAYAARHPEALAGVLLDSVVLTGADGRVADPDPVRTEHLAVACASSAACRRLPGDPAGTFAHLVGRLRGQPDPAVRPLSLLALLHSVSVPVVGREINAAVAAYLAGDPAPLRRLAAMIDGIPSGPARGAELAGVVAHRCADSSFPFDWTASPDERRAQLDRYYATERPYRPFTLGDLGGKASGWQEICAGWPAPPADPPVPPDARLRYVPALVLAGDFDSTTPAEAGRVAERFGATVSRVRFGGHNLTTGPAVDGCVRAATREFLADPAAFQGTPRCDRASYAAIGTYPRGAAGLRPARVPGLDRRQRVTVAAAIATVLDAAARRDPHGPIPSWLVDEPGLRGGRVAFDDRAGIVRPADVEYVTGFAVTGEIELPPRPAQAGPATARLQVRDGTGTHRLVLTFPAFRATPDTAVSGTFDGRAFTGTVAGR
ncbi:hypothetical protein Sru01_50190 [Sphaerisporangium rufum]|uniref:Alpha/beta hydrolase n=2 Tax=Sphaerisporangium rufum TaxID=1381558 RepID=A0A919V2T4_9ACTN|nr:hypothetical protein Sru01_50190 [Sphaerisporangium rufum]